MPVVETVVVVEKLPTRLPLLVVPGTSIDGVALGLSYVSVPVVAGRTAVSVDEEAPGVRLPELAVPGPSVDVVDGDVDEMQSLAQTETVSNWVTVEMETVVEVTVAVVSTQDELAAVGNPGEVLLADGTGNPLLGAGVLVENLPERGAEELDNGVVALADGVLRLVKTPVPTAEL